MYFGHEYSLRNLLPVRGVLLKTLYSSIISFYVNLSFPFYLVVFVYVLHKNILSTP